MGIFDFFTNPQKAVEDVASNVTSKAASAGGNLLKAPLDALSGMAHGVFNLWNVVKFACISLGTQVLAGPLYNAAYGKIFGPEALRKLEESREKNGPAGILLHSAEDGAIISGILGGASGAMQGGGLLGGGLVLATVAAVTIGALHKGDVKVADNDSHALPPTIPLSLIHI